MWSEEHKRRLWRRIWVALAEAEHEAKEDLRAGRVERFETLADLITDLDAEE